MTCFRIFSLYIRKYFDFSQHAVFTICIYIIHYSSNKNIGYVWKGIKATGTAPPPPVLKFLDPPLLTSEIRECDVNLAPLPLHYRSLTLSPHSRGLQFWGFRGQTCFIPILIHAKKILQVRVYDRKMFENTIILPNWAKIVVPMPGIEPGPPGWKPGILTTRPHRSTYKFHVK